MPRQDDMLYPVGYTEPEPEAQVPSASRDTAAVRAIIEDVTSTEPLTVEQCRKLICGHYGTGGEHYDVSNPAERDQAIAAVKLGRNLRGPDCGASFRSEEVDAIVREVIADREASWTFLSEAGAEAEPK